MARSIVKPGGAHGVTDRRYALGLGCEVQYADAVVYADSLKLTGPVSPIGVSCRICERDRCAQRAFPPVDRRITVPSLERRVVPFSLADGA
jgi:predicted transcriptional regulator